MTDRDEPPVQPTGPPPATGFRHTTQLRHGKVTLALHDVASAADETVRPLLMLHGLGECTPVETARKPQWRGRVLGLDFTGHGASTVPVGGGYTSEILVGDVDSVLCHLDEPVTILGRGLGAYIGLLAAAARPDLVHGVVLADGPGLAGGGVHPGSRAIVNPTAQAAPPDPYALMELARDVRPADYARTFALFVVDGSELDVPLWVAAIVRPAWVEAILELPGVATGSVQHGLEQYLP